MVRCDGLLNTSVTTWSRYVERRSKNSHGSTMGPNGRCVSRNVHAHRQPRHDGYALFCQLASHTARSLHSVWANFASSNNGNSWPTKKLWIAAPEDYLGSISNGLPD